MAKHTRTHLVYALLRLIRRQGTRAHTDCTDAHAQRTCAHAPLPEAPLPEAPLPPRSACPTRCCPSDRPRPARRVRSSCAQRFATRFATRAHSARRRLGGGSVAAARRLLGGCSAAARRLLGSTRSAASRRQSPHAPAHGACGDCGPGGCMQAHQERLEREVRPPVAALQACWPGVAYGYTQTRVRAPVD